MIELKAYAKINLGLHIRGKRPDGFHEIDTVLHRIDLADVLSFSDSRNIEFETDSTEIPLGNDNLCLRAARLMQIRFQTDRGAKIRLLKRIPVGAGLGGGSADSGSTLLGLHALWNLPGNVNELLPIAAELGSDVPYFLHAGTASASGRGEILDYFPFSLPFYVALAFPRFRISTAWAYQNVLTSRLTAGSRVREILMEGVAGRSLLPQSLRNDLESVVLPAYPAVGEIRRALYDHGATFALMSGSGSAVYGLFADERPAREALDSLKSTCDTFLTRPAFGA